MQIEIPLTKNVSEQDISGKEILINIYPRKTIGKKYKFNLVHTAGLADFCTLPTYPVLGLHENKNRMFAVTPSKMYEIFNNGEFKELGDVELTGRVSMEDNGKQLVVVDGKRGFYFNGFTEEVKEIVNDAFYPASTVAFQDGYFLFDRVGTSQFFISKLLDVDFDPLDFATAEGQPDDIVAIVSDHREIFIFGKQTIEIWYNSGDKDFPFERNSGVFIEKGCSAKHTIAKQNNSIFFIGSDLIVYHLIGYQTNRISTHIVEKSLNNIDLNDTFAYTYEEQGHYFYVLTIPPSNITWVYDSLTRYWHIKQSYQFGRHLSNNAIFFNYKTLVGDFQNGKIYEMSNLFYMDSHQPIIRKITLPPINDKRNYLTVDSLELDMGRGIGTENSQASDPQIRVYFSKDSGKTYCQNFKVGKIGKIGQFNNRVKVNRFGVAREFIFTIEISDPIPLDIGGAWVDVR